MRSRLGPLNVPVPWRLPYGGWFLAFGDHMGAHVVAYHLVGHPFEELQWRYLRSVLGPGMTFVDVGANQGFFSILASRSVGPTGTVLAFEPARSERKKLGLNLWLNRCRNVTVERVALGEAVGESAFYEYRGGFGSYSSLRPAAPDVIAPARETRVELRRLDDWKLERLDILKIDAEGAELGVLRGGRETLARCRPRVLCEVSAQRLAPWGLKPSDVLDELARAGYECFGLNQSGPVANVADENVVAIPTH